ncbi:MAG: lamin tail domain-containing protein [Bacteroidales bacterium]|nr:lamin tail domain-containing protein [Bacteroidales bacterium]
MRLFLLSFLTLFAILASSQIKIDEFDWQSDVEGYSFLESDAYQGSPTNIYAKVDELSEINVWHFHATIKSTLSNANRMWFYFLADEKLTKGMNVRIGNNAKNIVLCNEEEKELMSADDLFTSFPAEVDIVVRKSLAGSDGECVLGMDVEVKCDNQTNKFSEECNLSSAYDGQYVGFNIQYSSKNVDNILIKDLDISTEELPQPQKPDDPGQSQDPDSDPEPAGPLTFAGYEWSGMTTDYVVSNGQLELRSQSEKSPAFIATEVAQLDTVAEWNMTFRYENALSSSNMMRVFLTAEDDNLKSGIFLQFGGTNKTVSLNRRKNGTNTSLVAMDKDFLSSTTGKVSVVVRREMIDNTYNYYLEAEKGESICHAECIIQPSAHPIQNYMGVETVFSKTRKEGVYFLETFETSGRINIILNEDSESDTGTDPDPVGPLTFAGYEWSGMATDYVVSDGQLELRSRSEKSPAFIATEVARLDTVAEWKMMFRYENALSSSNMMRVFLTAEDDSLKSGVFVQFGGTNKTVSLNRRKNGTNTSLAATGKDFLSSMMGEVAVVVRREMIDNTYKYSIEASKDSLCRAECIIQPSAHPKQNYMGVETVFSKTRKEGVYFLESLETNGRLNIEEKPESSDIFFRGCVVINEIMSNPSDEYGLPSVEYVEIINTSKEVLDLTEWTISNGNATGVLAECYVGPEECVIICGQTHVDEFKPFGKVCAAKPWPTLANNGGRIILSNADGVVADYIDYSAAQYGESFKSKKGWSLEKCDPFNMSQDKSCWKPSEASMGGTPGCVNSVVMDQIDTTSPVVKNLSINKAGTLIYLTFSEPVDTTTFEHKIRIGDVQYEFSIVDVDNVTLADFTIALNTTVASGAVYSVGGISVEDLAGNSLEMGDMKLAVPAPIGYGDIVINEIMSNANPSSADFVEIYNRSQSTFDLHDLFFGQKSDGILKSCTRMSETSRLMFPGDYIVLCNDSLIFVASCSPLHPEMLVGNSQLGNLPSEGTFTICLIDGYVIDELTYSESMYSQLQADHHNVSLERIKTDGPTNDAANWTSASSFCGYSTPTEVNSQNRDGIAKPESDIEMIRRKFTPNGDGTDSEMVIATRFDDGQWNATMKIFTSYGELIAMPLNNTPMSVSGELRWDGRSDNGQVMSPGTYIVYISAWQTGGKRKEFKRSCVILPPKQ